MDRKRSSFLPDFWRRMGNAWAGAGAGGGAELAEIRIVFARAGGEPQPSQPNFCSAAGRPARTFHPGKPTLFIHG